MDPQEYDEIIRHLVQIAAHQDTINDDLRAMLNTQGAMLSTHETLLTRQATTNERLEITQARVETTLARIETLLARMIRQGENGKNA